MKPCASTRAVGAAALVVLSATLATGVVGCSSASRSTFMTAVDATHAGLSRAADAATIVFVRPSATGNNPATILDDGGIYLGEVLPSGYFAVRRSPGRHVFVGWGDSTDVLEADVEASMVYVVEVRVKAAWLYGGGMSLVPVKRGSAQWAVVEEWLATSTAYTPDQARGQKYVDRNRAEAAEHIARARKRLAYLAEHNPKYLAAHSIAATDGR